LNLMTVDGYHAQKLKFDEERNQFRGEILGFLEERTFYGIKSRMNFVREFKKSTDVLS